MKFTLRGGEKYEKSALCTLKDDLSRKGGEKKKRRESEMFSQLVIRFIISLTQIIADASSASRALCC